MWNSIINEHSSVARAYSILRYKYKSITQKDKVSYIFHVTHLQTKTKNKLDT